MHFYEPDGGGLAPIFQKERNNMKNFDDFILSPADIPNNGYIFADHSAQRRSGHLGHALLECLDGELLGFYPNCNDDNKGHSGNGWMEIRRSYDHGITWSEPEKDQYSYAMWASSRGRTAMCEKGVTTDQGTLVIFYVLCDMQINGSIWEPYWIPTFSRSKDNGHAWSTPRAICDLRGRIYDARFKDGIIFALMFANDATEHFVGVRAEHQYQLYISRDDGCSFDKLSNISLPTQGRGYGCMEFLENGDLIAYAYDINDEAHPDYCISHDCGKTWGPPQKTYLAKSIRNPQIVSFGGGYFMHGRSGSLSKNPGHFVIYYSNDGINWDNGHYMQMCTAGAGAYSNNLVVGKYSPQMRQRLLIHTSHAYDENRTNTYYWWIDKR